MYQDPKRAACIKAWTNATIQGVEVVQQHDEMISVMQKERQKQIKKQCDGYLCDLNGSVRR